jgi:HEAT repeat protein
VRRNLWISTVLLATAGVFPVARGADTVPSTQSAVPLPSTDRYRAALLATDTRPATRDESARRLAAGGSRADVAALRDGLVAGGLPGLSAARAVAATVDPDPSWLGPLGNLLGPNAAATNAAATKDVATALANYAPTPSGAQALSALRTFATGGAPAPTRSLAVRAMGPFLARDKSLAGYLVDAIGGPSQSIQAAAASVLSEATGETGRGTSAALWRAWWESHVNDPPAAWRAYLDTVRDRMAGPARVRQRELADTVTRLLENNYSGPPATRMRILASYLDAPSAPIRAIGAKLALGELSGSRQVLDAALPRIRDLIADEDPDVRTNAIATVRAAVDPQAGPVLVAQLPREPDPAVLRLLIETVGTLQVLDAGPALVRLLDDPRPDVAAAAAHGLGEPETHGLGRLLRSQRPAVADRACAAIHRILSARPTPATDGLRVEATRDLAALGDPQAFNTYRNLLNAQPEESSRVRQAALAGLGTLGDTNADATVSAALNDPDPLVRLAAAKAMRTVGQLSEIAQLENEMQQDPDADVREAAWQALSHLLENGGVDLLSNWVTRFPRDPAHRLVIQQAYGRALQAAGQLDGVAANNQAIAQTLVDDLKRPDEAIAPLQAALDYYQNNAAAGAPDRLENLVSQMLTAQLKARRWTAAAEFAGREIKAYQTYQQVAGQRFEDAAETLKADHDMAGLNGLIAAANSVQPPLEKRFIDFMQQIREELRASPR